MKIEKLTRKILLNLTKVNEEDFKFLLSQLCIKDKSHQLKFFLEYMHRNFKLIILINFIPFIIEKIKTGFITFKGKKYKLEEFCKELVEYTNDFQIKYRELKKYKVKSSKCPKCEVSLIVGQPKCIKCNIHLKW